MRLTVLFPKFFTLQLRYAVFPSSAVTFLEAATSTYGPLRTSSPASATVLLLLLLLVVPELAVTVVCVVATELVLLPLTTPLALPLRPFKLLLLPPSFLAAVCD